MFLSMVLPSDKRLYLPLLQQRCAGSVDGWGQRCAEANLQDDTQRRSSGIEPPNHEATEQRATEKGLWQTSIQSILDPMTQS